MIKILTFANCLANFLDKENMSQNAPYIFLTSSLWRSLVLIAGGTEILAKKNMPQVHQCGSLGSDR